MPNNNPKLPPIESTTNSKKKFLTIFVVLIVTAALLYFMMLLKPKEEKKQDTTIIPSVNIVNLKAIDYVIPIKSDGMVQAKTTITLSAEVTGSIVDVSKKFSNGGKFNEGDILLRIDPIDYELAITRAKANVAAQQANLDLQQAKSDLAKIDWKKYGKKGKPNALNLNLPQVASAKAALSGANADLKLANRNLNKSIIKAPFTGVILTKSVDLGQFVSMGTPLASIASTEIAEVRISLSDKQLEQSGLNRTVLLNTTKALITSQEAQDIQWHGHVAAIEAQRDAKTLFNYAIIEIQQPFTQQAKQLRINTFVSVTLQGQTLKNVFRVERGLVTLNQEIKVLSLASTLELKKVEIAYADDDYYYLSSGISESDNIITTGLSSVYAGDKLQVKKN